MLQSIRERAQGVVAWFIVVLITIPFALFGINEYLGGGSEPIVASVNDREITEREFENRYRDFRQRLRQRLGQSYRPELLDEAVLRQQVLDSMIRDELIIQASDKLGLRAGNSLVQETIIEIPNFQIDGRFNVEAYERGVRSQGLTPGGFEERVRSAVVSEQMAKAIGGSAFTTASEVETTIKLRLQQREISYLTIPVDSVKDQVAVSDAEIQSHYDANPTNFMAQEKAKVEYLELDIDNIAKTLTTDDESLLGYYEQHKDEYITPEQRQARHILFSIEGDTDEVAAKQAAEAALARIRTGEDFAAVAKELSQDPGSADLGGDLGYFESGIMDDAFDKAVFSMAEGEISEPIQSSFGYHIIEVTGIRPEQGKSYEEAKIDIEKAYLRSEAERLFYEYAENLSNLAYEDPNSLQPAADALGIEIQQSDWITRDTRTGLFAAPKVINAVFSEEVLREGNNSEAIELSSEHVVVVRVTEHEESSLRPLDEVKEDITAILTREKSAELTKQKGEALLSTLKGGKSLSEVAETEGFALEQPGMVKRDNREVPAEIVRKAFQIARPASDAASYGDSQLLDGSFAVIAVLKVEDGKNDDLTELGGEQGVKQALERARADRYFQLLVDELRDNASIVIHNTQSEG
ncbi:MAG: SurA N-terminal domain-containing protein [Chromatiales bacterium]|nr:SurA N-terminal domain-containing protein [Chromatiales bacterium]